MTIARRVLLVSLMAMAFLNGVYSAAHGDVLGVIGAIGSMGLFWIVMGFLRGAMESPY